MSEESQPVELLQQGISAVKAGRKEEAHEALLQVIKLDERNEQAWLWLSAVVDSTEERQICLENVLAINPANAHARAGLDWLRQSRPEPEVLTPEPEPPGSEPEPPLHAGEPCPRCRASVRATSSTCPSCGLPLVVTCPRCGEYAGVEQPTCLHCGQVLGDFRKGPAFYLGLASLYLQNHAVDHAQEALRWAEEEAAGDADVLAQVAAQYEEAGFWNPAIATLERAIEAAPGDPAHYIRLGAAYRQHGERARAAALYQKAADLGSEDPAVICELARMELETGAAQKAVARLQPLLRKQPVEPQAILLMGDALQSLGDQDAAVAHYRRVTQLVRDDSEVAVEARGKLALLGAVPSRQDRRAGSRSAPGRRPGCVTLYALLTIASALTGILGAVGLAAVYAGSRPEIEQAVLQMGMEGLINLDSLTPYLGVALGFALLSAMVNLVIGVGLWLLKNWARVAVILLSLLGLIASLAWVARIAGAFRQTAMAAGANALPAPVIGSLLFSFVIQALIVFWFILNRDAFD